ncbi:helix-turn-helix domain-containing protein [Dyella sp. AtDHG13]|uniref:helix-turn-helix transcriptional regulator n=1 Tax=Dyella sp. AtDHG13 TaxID=1938897 RepID=UPI0031B63A64
MSQEELALRADVDRTCVSQIERAIGNPSLLVPCKLSAVLGVDVKQLFDSD